MHDVHEQIQNEQGNHFQTTVHTVAKGTQWKTSFEKNCFSVFMSNLNMSFNTEGSIWYVFLPTRFSV